MPALALAVTLVAAAATDLEERIIPNRLMAAGACWPLVLWTLADPGRLPENLIAGRRGGRVPAARRDRLPRRHGHGRREARRA